MPTLRKPLSGFSITFSNGNTAQAICVEQKTELPAALETIGLQTARPVLVLIGGASQLNQQDFNRIQSLFVEVLAPLAEELGAIVVDGGTDAGVMKLMGHARSITYATFPLVGVSPKKLVKLPDDVFTAQSDFLDSPPSAQVSALLPGSERKDKLKWEDKSNQAFSPEPNHTHFVLVPGVKWGDESEWIAWTASAVARNQPSVTVLINGGDVSLIDIRCSTDEARPIAVVAGSGRLADRIANAFNDSRLKVTDPTISALLQNGQFDRLNLANPNHEIETFLKKRLSEIY